jgi:hypothetical protein
VRGEGKERLTALGSLATELGTEYVFGKGNNVHNVYPDSSGFIVLHPTLQYEADGPGVSGVTFSPAVTGSDDADHFEYRLLQITPHGEEYPVADWFPQNQLDRPRKLPLPLGEGYLKIQVRSADGRNTVFESMLPLKRGEEIKPLNVNPAGVDPAQQVKDG